MNKNVILSSIFASATIALIGFASIIDPVIAVAAPASNTLNTVQSTVIASSSSTARLRQVSVSVVKNVSKVAVEKKVTCDDYNMWSSGDESVRICSSK